MLSLAASNLKPADITALFLGLAVLLLFARIMGEFFQRFGLPSVIGEILAGVFLGQTVLGAISSDAFDFIFPSPDAANPQAGAIALRGFVIVSASFLLLVAGLEVDLGSVWRQGKSVVVVSFTGIILPFTTAALVAWFLYQDMGIGSGPADATGKALLTMQELRLPFALFVGIALSISALPVIAKILMDLNLLKSDMGMLIMSAAMLNDIVGWVLFAVVQAMLTGQGNAATIELIIYTVVFIVLMVTVGRLAFHRIVPHLQAHWTWPGGVIGFVLVIALLCAALTEWIGIHSIFGAFIAGVAIGDTRHLRERTRETIHQFITNIFAPVFFASIALRVDFVESFNLPLILGVLSIAIVGKVVGTFVGCTICGMNKKESASVGFGMAAQGTMGVILGELARSAGLIGPELFEAIIITALVTSIISGPAIQRILKPARQRLLGEFISDRNFIPQLNALTTRQAIEMLSSHAARLTNLQATDIFEAVWRREQIMSTGLGHELAVPHARLQELDKPVIILARSEQGIDFNANDGKPARIICLLLTPMKDANAQIELLAMFAQAFTDPHSRKAAMSAETFTEFLAAMKLPGEGKEAPVENEES